MGKMRGGTDETRERENETPWKRARQYKSPATITNLQLVPSLRYIKNEGREAEMWGKRKRRT